MKKRNLFTLALTLTALMAGILIGSSRKGGDEFKAFNYGLTNLTDELVREVKTHPTLMGVEKAQDILTAREQDLRESLAISKTKKASQLSGGPLTEFSDNLDENRQKLKRLLNNADVKAASESDPEFRRRLSKLISAYLSITD